MAIQISSGFKIGSTEPIDSRLVLTKREMVAMKDTLMPESYISICKDDHRVYSYNKSNKFNTETGKFRILESIIKGYYNDGEFYEDGGLTILSPKSLDTIYVDLDSNITYVYRPSAGNYIEFITIRSGSEGNYTYAWEKIGSTKADLTGYVTKETTVAGIKLDHNITAAELEASTALNLGDLAHKDSAEGTVAGQTISGVKATGSVSGTAAITLTSTDISSSGSYTPDGEVSISITKTIEENKGLQIEGTISKPDITVKEESTAVIKQLTSVGTVASLTEGSYTAPTLANATTSTFAKEGVTASIDATDSEMLVIATASTASAVTEQGKFDAGKVEFGKFTPNTLPVLEQNGTTVLTGVSASLVSAPTFTSDKYVFDGSFKGTEATVSVSGKYDKANTNAVVTASDISLDVGDITVAAKDVTVK